MSAGLEQSQVAPPGVAADDVVISVRNVGKMYRIYNQPQDRLKHMLFWRFGKQYGRDFWALRNISFDIRRGETLGIIGRNGSGKSTLLQIIAGTLAPTEGEVTVRGRVAALLELGSGFNPEFTGRENVYLNGAILGLSRDEIEQRFAAIAAFADIGDFIEQPVKFYSSGMMVRLAFAVQASVEPDILIVDEALAVGDVFFTQKCYRRLGELIDRGVAVVLVSHDMAAVSQYCSRVMTLDSGKELYLGDPVTALRRYLALQRGETLALRERVVVADSDSRNAPALPDSGLEQFWPAAEAFLDLSGSVAVGNGQAELTAVAVCDEQNEPCQVFEMGSFMHVYYEFLTYEALDVPIGGMSIINSKNVIVHGKNSLQYRVDAPKAVPPGIRLRFRQSTRLDLAPGDYTFVIGLAMMGAADYQHVEHMHHGHVDELTTRVLSVGQVGAFSVTLHRQGLSLTHHGLCDLPGSSQLVMLTEDVSKVESR